MIVAAAILMLLSLGIVVGLVARTKGRAGLVWGIYGLVAAPFALPHVLLLRGQDGERRWSPIRTGLPSAMKPCPHCGAAIQGEALACRYCHKPFYAREDETGEPPSRREFEALERALARRGTARAPAAEPRPVYAPADPEGAAAPGPAAGAAAAHDGDRDPARAPEGPPARPPEALGEAQAEPEPAPEPAARRRPEPDPDSHAGPTPVPWPEAPPAAEPPRRHAPASATRREPRPVPVVEFASVPWPEFAPESEPEPEAGLEPQPEFEAETAPEFETDPEPEPEPEFAAPPAGERMPPREPPRLAMSGEAVHWPPIEPLRDEEPGALRRALAPAAFVAALVFAAAVVFAPEWFRTREDPLEPASSASVDPAAPGRGAVPEEAGQPDDADAPSRPAEGASDGPAEGTVRDTEVAGRQIPAVPATGTGAGVPDPALASPRPISPPGPPSEDAVPPAASPAAASPAPPSPPASRALPVRISASGQLVAEVQRRLKAEGYDPGPVDGRAGPRTREALAAYQRAQHLVATGEIDDAVLFELGFD